MSDFRSRLEADPPKPWKFDTDGPMIVGTFRGLEFGTTAYGQCPVVTLELEDGTERSVWCFHTVLRNEMKRSQPKLGERVGILYLGKIHPEGGAEYVGYRVKVDREDGDEIDWSRVGDPGDVAPEVPELVEVPPEPDPPF
jgi:hypothetical protein